MQYSSAIKWKAKVLKQESIEEQKNIIMDFYSTIKNSVTCIKMDGKYTDTIQAQKDKRRGVGSHFSSGNLHVFYSHAHACNYP